MVKECMICHARKDIGGDQLGTSHGVCENERCKHTYREWATTRTGMTLAEYVALLGKEAS